MTKLVMATLTDTPMPTIDVDAEVAQHRVEVGAAHRAEAVEALEHEVARLGAELGQQRGAGAAGREVDAELAGGVEQAGVGVGAEVVGPAHGEAVHDRHDAARAAATSRTMLGTAARPASSARSRRHGELADDADLALLGDEGAARRVEQGGEVDGHGRTVGVDSVAP